jgi:hypothetical protein
MRTTITLHDDTAAAVDDLRRREGLGLSEAVNRLIRDGLSRSRSTTPYVHRSFDLGLKVDVTNVAEVLELLDEDQ